MTERYRAENERSTWMRFHTQTAGVSLTPQQPLNNLTRVAIQALAAVLGGTQSLHTDAYDEALAVPTAEAALLALRQQQIIAEETGVANTIDPLGGSWFVESLTNETEREVWRYLDEIDRRGGMVAAIERGLPPARDRRRGLPLPARARRRRAADRRGQRLRRRGRGDADPGPRGAGRARSSATWPGSSGRAASATRRRSSAALAGLREAARRPGSSDDEPDAPLHPLRRRPTRRSASSAASCARSSASTASRSRGRYDPRMYLDALSFLEDERDAWRPFEALNALTDEQLERPVEAAHGWSGRDLMGHLVAWQLVALDVAKELAVGERSAAKERGRRRLGGSAAATSSTTRSSADWRGEADRRGPPGVRARRGRAARLPDRRAGGALDQERRPPALLHRRDDRPLRRASQGPRRDPRRRSGRRPRDRRRPLDGSRSTTRPTELEDAERTAAADGSTVEWSIAAASRSPRSAATGRVPARPAGREGGAADAGHRGLGARRGLGRVLAAGARRARDRPGEAWLVSAWRRADGESCQRRRPDTTRRRDRAAGEAQPRRRGGGRWTSRLPPGEDVDRGACRRSGGPAPRRIGSDHAAVSAALGSAGSGLGRGRVLGEPELGLELLHRPEARRRPSAACPGGRTRSSGCS